MAYKYDLKTVITIEMIWNEPCTMEDLITDVLRSNYHDGRMYEEEEIIQAVKELCEDDEIRSKHGVFILNTTTSQIKEDLEELLEKGTNDCVHRTRFFVKQWDKYGYDIFCSACREWITYTEDYDFVKGQIKKDNKIYRESEK